MREPRLTRSEARRLRQAWDRQQQFHIPEREERFRVMLDVLRETMPRRPRILDLGCGTGSLSERVLRELPGARVWAVDFDPVLLRVGREGLGDMQGRLTWVETDLRRKGWGKVLPRLRFDAAVSTTALHWLTDAQLRALFRTLGRIVRPGGVVLNGDSMPFDYAGHAAAYPRISKVVRAVRASRPTARGPPGVLSWDEWWSDVEGLPALAREVAERRRRYPHSHESVPSPSASWQIAELGSAGFREAAVVWQRWTNRVLLAIR